MARALTNTLFSYVDSLRPIIYINHFDPHILDDLLVKAVGDNVKIEMFDNALGWLTAKTTDQKHDLASFLDAARTGGFEMRMFLVLFDIHESLSRPDVTALLKRIAIDNLNLEGYNITVFIISSSLVVPHELSWCISVIDVPVPDEKETAEIIREFGVANEIIIDDAVAREFVVSFKGLDEFQIRQILNLAYQDGGSITLTDKRLIFQEKKQIIMKSGLLEYVQAKETYADIGGLDALKYYMNKKARIFRSLGGATKFGVDIPKGVLIAGMPGCGKSLIAKATAALFEMPLIRLDIGRLTGKYAAESEENMITALKMVEVISPCVLWIDEIEKVFMGAAAGTEDYYASYRMFRRFLMWFHEKNNTAYIVATANDISRVPVEFLRKGCFDELFFADLPDDDERRKILFIHLNKRNKLNKEISLPRLAYETQGLSGADLEGLVKEAVEAAFVDGQRKVTTKDLLRARANNKSVSELLEHEIESLDKQRKDLNFKFANERVARANGNLSEILPKQMDKAKEKANARREILSGADAAAFMDEEENGGETQADAYDVQADGGGVNADGADSADGGHFPQTDEISQAAQDAAPLNVQPQAGDGMPRGYVPPPLPIAEIPYWQAPPHPLAIDPALAAAYPHLAAQQQQQYQQYPLPQQPGGVQPDPALMEAVAKVKDVEITDADIFAALANRKN